ncbi:MAG: hypothetical protein WCP95_01705 [Actinomycetes bacterium]
MRLTRALLATFTSVAVALVPATSASAADQVTWPQVQAAAKAAQTNVMLGGGTVTDEVAAKISYREVTDYRPGGAVTRASYREAGMTDSEPDATTWTVTKNGVGIRYQPMPSLPKAGRYPTLRKASWVRADPEPAGSTPPVLRLLAFDPVGAISSSSASDAGIVSASWTYGADGSPGQTVSATFTQLPTGALVLQSFSTKTPGGAGPGSTQTVQVTFTNPKLIVPDFSSALPESYVKAALHAAQDTTAAYYSVRNAASSAREKAATMTRRELIAHVRSQVAANQDFSHPPADPSTDTITNVDSGLRLTNPNAYSGQSSTWTISVTPDKRVVVTKRTKSSKVVAPP